MTFYWKLNTTEGLYRVWDKMASLGGGEKNVRNEIILNIWKLFSFEKE